MATGVASWSQTASSNASADSAVNWAEGQAPSSVNDSGRGMMSSVAKYRDDNAGSLTTGGTSTAYTLTTNQVFASLSAMSGQVVFFQAHTASGASPTLNVDSLGAKALKSVSGTALATGYLLEGGIYAATYSNSGSEWVVHGLPGALGTLASATITALSIGSSIAPLSSDSAALGSSSLMFSDLFLASGAVINFNNGDVTATHSANTLAFAGASSGYTFDAGVTTTGALSAATAAGAIIASQAEMETGTATDKVVPPGRVQHHPGVAKAWGQVTYSGGTPTLITSHNIGSIVDGGVGILTFNFTTPMSGVNYCAIATMFGTGGGGLLKMIMVESQDANSVQVKTFVATAAGNTTAAAVDIGGINIVMYGDQ